MIHALRPSTKYRFMQMCLCEKKENLLICSTDSMIQTQLNGLLQNDQRM